MSLVDYADRIIKGDRVIQYIIEWVPDWITARKNKTIERVTPIGMLSIEAVAKIKKVSNKTIADKIISKELNGGEHANNWYVNPDVALDTWITSLKDPGPMLRRLLFLQDSLDFYTGSDIKEMYAMAEEMEAAVGPELKGRHAKKSIQDHFNKYFDGYVPKTIEGLKKYIEDYIEAVEKKKKEVYQ